MNQISGGLRDANQTRRKNKALRKRDGQRQDDLAAALGVTSQAISRWEANGGYPDIEMIPAIANYFGITIDELFGYESDRTRICRSANERYYTSSAVKRAKIVENEFAEAEIAAHLSEDWPWWSVDGSGKVKAEMQDDSRWNEWAKRTQA